MKIELSPDIERIVKKQVDSGLYDSPNDFVQQAVLWAAKLQEAKLKRLRNEISKAIEQLENGEGIAVENIDDFFSEIEAEIERETEKIAA